MTPETQTAGRVVRATPAGPGPVTSRGADPALVLWMVALTAIWGLNAVSVRAVIRGVTPIMGGAVRGGIATALIAAYGMWRGESLHFTARQVFQGSIAGLIFATEAVFLYNGARFTNAGHIAIFVNTAPFFVAGGAHFLLAEERLNWLKGAGLVLAFSGVVALFSDQLLVREQGFWRGDLLVMVAAMTWASSTLYIKVFLAGRFTAVRLMFVRIASSTVMLLAASLLTEREPFFGAGAVVWGGLAFQGAVVVFFSYMMWVVLLQRYAATAMQPFTFLSPVWGVAAGVALLGEQFSLALFAGMALVGAGLYLVNRPPPGGAAKPAP